MLLVLIILFDEITNTSSSSKTTSLLLRCLSINFFSFGSYSSKINELNFEFKLEKNIYQLFW